jgi:hypothetical protein
MPESNMPPAARRQAEEANRLIAALNSKPGVLPEGAHPQTEIDDPRLPSMDPRAQPAPQAAPNMPSELSQPPANELPPPTSAQSAPPPREEEDFRHKYNTLRGKYDAEMRTMRSIMETQQQTMDKLIETRASPAAAAPAAPELSNEDFLRSLGVTDKEISDYGELLPIVVKMARNMIKPTADKLAAELEQTKRAAGTTSAALVQDRRTALFAYLDSTVPTWRAINEQQEFLDWLDQGDIFSGTSRRASLTQAFNNLESTRVAGIFQAFIQEDSAKRSTSGPAVDPNTLIAPGVPRGGAAEAPGGANGKRIWSEKEIGDFYTRVRLKKITKDEYDRTSKEIATAVAEGRVKPAARDHHANR